MYEKITHILLLLLIAAAPARAADAPPPRSPEEVVRLANQGADLAKEGRYDDAIRIWLEILPETRDRNRLDLRYNIYRAYRKAGKHPQAWHHLTTYLKNNTGEDLKAGEALERLERRLRDEQYVKVAITCEPSDASIHLETATTGPRYPCPLTWWFLSGETYKHFVHVSREGHHPKTVELDLINRGAKGGVKVTLVPKNALPVKTPKPDGPPIITDTRADRPDNTWKWTLVGTGAAIALGGGISQGIGEKALRDLNGRYSEGGLEVDMATKNAYDREYNEKVLPKRLAAYVLYGIGGATAVTGAVLLFIRDSDADHRAAVTPLWFDRGGGLSVGLSY